MAPKRNLHHLYCSVPSFRILKTQRTSGTTTRSLLIYHSLIMAVELLTINYHEYSLP
jgi:hypothetical protein